MSIKLNDYFGKDKEIDFTKVSIFDEIVLGIIEETKPKDRFVVTIQREEPTVNYKESKIYNNFFSWVNIPSLEKESLKSNTNLAKAS